MPTIVNELDAASRDRWEAFVQTHPDATFFHRAGWKDVIERSFGHRTHYLYAERSGNIVGVLPLAHYRSLLFGNALLSNACCMGGGTVAVDQDAHDELDKAAATLMERLRADYIEYRQPARRHPDWPARDNLYATFEWPIASDEEANLKQIPRKQRAVVRKTLSTQLMADIDTDLDAFYRLYASNVHKLGTPVFAKSYFRALKNVFGKDCEILTVRLNGQPQSSVLSFYFRDRVMPYYTGSIGSARETGANDFMYWQLMRRAVHHGYKVFDFGRSKVGTGPYSFKKNWGFTPCPVVHEFLLRKPAALPEINPTNPKFRVFIALWKKLPLPVANVLGPHVVRGIG